MICADKITKEIYLRLYKSDDAKTQKSCGVMSMISIPLRKSG
jgi:hypothetical protein